jgi:hypothetical protein
MHRSVFIAALVAAAAACSKKDDKGGLAPAASGLSESTAEPTSTTWHYVIDAASQTHVDLPGIKEHIVGGTSAASGTLDVVPTNVAQSRGIVRVDLSTFATRTFGNADDATQTKHARTWLEVVVDDKTNEDMRWAEFAVRSIDAPSATDITTVSPVRDGGDEVRAVSMTLHGDLLVHGHKVQEDEAVDVSFHYAPGALASSKPSRIDIVSKQPMRVILKEHDIRPRDPAGQVLAWTTSLVAKVAETADVTFALAATPAP